MPDLYLYSTPPDAAVTLTLDSGAVLHGIPCEANGRTDAHRLRVLPDTPTQGGLLHVTCDGMTPFSGRGIVEVVDDDVAFLYDDIHLQELPPPPSLPPRPNPYQDPFAIIQAVYEQGEFDLSEKEGCGEYTEAACLELFKQQSWLWGHIRKKPEQNQWAGHAVDAVMLLVKAGDTDAGIYDIILDTESENAKPAWTWKGPPDANLFMPVSEVEV